MKPQARRRRTHYEEGRITATGFIIDFLNATDRDDLQETLERLASRAPGEAEGISQGVLARDAGLSRIPTQPRRRGDGPGSAGRTGEIGLVERPDSRADADGPSLASGGISARLASPPRGERLGRHRQVHHQEAEVGPVAERVEGRFGLVLVGSRWPIAAASRHTVIAVSAWSAPSAADIVEPGRPASPARPARQPPGKNVSFACWDASHRRSRAVATFQFRDALGSSEANHPSTGVNSFRLNLTRIKVNHGRRKNDGDEERGHPRCDRRSGPPPRPRQEGEDPG